MFLQIKKHMIINYPQVKEEFTAEIWKYFMPNDNKNITLKSCRLGSDYKGIYSHKVSRRKTEKQ